MDYKQKVESFRKKYNIGPGLLVTFKGADGEYITKNIDLKNPLKIFAQKTHSLQHIYRNISDINSINRKPIQFEMQENKETKKDKKELEDKISNILSPVHSPEEIAKKHNVDIEYVYAQLAKGIEIEKEHTEDEEVAKTIALAHLWERADYYEVLKVVEVAPSEVPDSALTENVLKEQPEDAPVLTDIERKEKIIGFKRQMQEIVSALEDILLNVEEVQSLPSKLNVANRVSSILTVVKSLEGDLDSYSTIVENFLRKPRKNKDEEDGDDSKDDKDIEKKKKDKKELLFGVKEDVLTDRYKDLKFDKDDVETILKNNYKIVDETPGVWVITVRNPYRTSKLSLIAYNFTIYYGENYMGVYPTYIDKDSERLTAEIEENILNDLVVLNGGSITTLQEEERKKIPEDLIYDEKVNKLLSDFLNKTYLNVDIPIVYEKYYQVGEDFETKMDNAVKSEDNEINFNVEYGMNWSGVRYETQNEQEGIEITINIQEVWNDYITSIKGDYNTPEDFTSNPKLIHRVVSGVLIDGRDFDLTTENKELLNKIFNK